MIFAESSRGLCWSLGLRCCLDALLLKEQIAKMNRFRLIGVVLLAMFALGCAMASAAQATSAPFFSVGGTRLVAGKTHNFDARLFSAFELKANGIRVRCTGLAVEKGVLLGSNEGEPGRDDETVKFSSCSLVEGNGFPECHLSPKEGSEEVSTTITTVPLKSEMVENVLEGAGGKQLLEEFFPQTGTTFATLFFGPKGECTIEAAKVTGSVAGEILTDEVGNTEKVELGTPKKESTSWLVNFPAVSISEVWLITGGGAKIAKTELEFGAVAAVLTGTALTLLANTKFEPEPAAKWSPLP